MQAIQVRKELTDEWESRGVQKGVEYAILTDQNAAQLDRVVINMIEGVVSDLAEEPKSE